LSVNQLERAFRTWPVLVERAKKRNTITYGELGSEIEVHHRAIRFILRYIQDYCIDAKLPPLTILIINSSGLPGDGFIAFDLDNFEEGLEYVYSYDWDMPNPFEFSSDGHSMESLVSELLADPGSSESIYTTVKTRGVQQMLFREALLAAYNGACAFTGIKNTDALEACHVVPWSQARKSERLDVRNGLLLNAYHHKLFDAGHITITHNHRIRSKEPSLSHSLSDIEKALTVDLHMKNMLSPRLEQHRPLGEYIDRHYELKGWVE
jgi:putative restriction endonuclease